MASAIAQPVASFTRPANTTQYTSGNLVANSATAASVVPMKFLVAVPTLCPGRLVYIRRARLQKSTTSATAATFRLHLYGTDPSASSGIANGDEGAWSTRPRTTSAPSPST